MRVAINGFGRIGRCLLRAWHGGHRAAQLDIVAINDVADSAAMTHLYRHDSSHGTIAMPVQHDGQMLLLGCASGQRQAQLLHCQGVADWGGLGVDMVLECSGDSGGRELAQAHLDAGADSLLFSQPSSPDVDATLIYGFNHRSLRDDQRILSAGSCTSNALVPVLAALRDGPGLRRVFARTLHSVMNDQPVMDSYHSGDLRKTRAAFRSLIPVDTALGRGVVRLMPELEGRIDCLAMRVPLTEVSAMELCVELGEDSDAGQLNAMMQRAAGDDDSVLGFCDAPLVSGDYRGDPRSAVVDGGQTRVVDGRLAHLLLWFDNEWAFAHRMLDLAAWVARRG